MDDQLRDRKSDSWDSLLGAVQFHKIERNVNSILIIQDDEKLAGQLKELCESNGFVARVALSAEAGMEQIQRGIPRLILLGVTLPGIDGLSAMRTFCGQMKIPTILLTEIDVPELKITGLGLGADDYITKPFHPGELIARIRRVLRRTVADRDSILAFVQTGGEGGCSREELNYLRAVFTEAPLRYYSCFLSHAEADSEFALKLYADLRRNKVTCWHYTQDIPTGVDWQDSVDKAVDSAEKLVLVCSLRSQYRDNVVREIMRAINAGRATGTQRFFPIRIDNHILSERALEDGREMVRCDKCKENWVAYISRIQIADFREWRNEEAYQRELRQLLSDLRRPPAIPDPTPKT